MNLTAQQETDVARFLEDLRGRACQVSRSFIIHHVFGFQTIFTNTVAGRCAS